MAVLVGGQSWGLSTSSKCRKKAVLLVKLTDSSVQSLEDYLSKRQKGFSSGTHKTAPIPTIQFPSENRELGAIHIPDDTSGTEQRFFFSLSSSDDTITKGGSFECLASSNNSYGNLESIGPLREKLHVKASQDAYTRFGRKMVEVKRENEKRTTQFLDREPSSAKRGLPTPSTRNSAIPNKTSISDSAPRQQYQHQYLSGNHPLLDRPRSNGEKAKKSFLPSAVNPELMRRPLRERIIHLLAVRPFKKPELLSRISRDGLLEKDRANVTAILKTVSFMKDNTYNLLRHIWNDVSEDWPFYSDYDRQCFRRRKPQNLTPPFSDGSTSSSGHSPSSTHPASPPQTTATSAKRAGQLVPEDGSDSGSPAAKRKRVSNYIRPPEMQRFGSPSRPAASSPGWSPSNVSIKDEDSEEDKEQNLLVYGKIVNREQRTRYKQEFNRDYETYRSLHQQLEKVSDRFAQLEKQLKNEKKGSAAWKSLKTKIMIEFQEKQKDKDYILSKKNFKHLHIKLAAIKKLVYEYDIGNNQAP